MDRPPPLAAGFTRIALLFESEEVLMPGAIARHCAVPLEQLGPILVNGPQASVDIANDVSKAVRERLEQLGPTQIIEIKERSYAWLRLPIGRNHGLSPTQLRRLLEKADAGPVGRFDIRNTHTLVGIASDRIEAVGRTLSGQRLNGIILTAEQVAHPGSAAYRSKR